MKCRHCAEEKGKGDRLPRGWKRDKSEHPVCLSCWKARYRLFAITIPVTGPVDGTWEDLRRYLHDAWQQSTRVANFVATELYARDIRRQPGDEKLGPMMRSYLYPELREAFPDMPTAALGSCERFAESKYRALRLKILWRREANAPSFRYPVPYSVHNATWKASYGKDGAPNVSVRLGDRRWTLRLRRGHNYRRQLAAFDQIAQGTARQGEMSFYRQKASKSDHREGTTGRDGGRQKLHYRTMCKMVAWFPIDKSREALHGAMVVARGQECLLHAYTGENKLFIVNGDHVIRWMAEHRMRLQRWSEDSKAGLRKKLNSKRQVACTKYRRRMDYACHELSSIIVKHAKRRRFAEIKFLDIESSYGEEFPWFKLKTMIEYKAKADGIGFDEIDPEAKE